MGNKEKSFEENLEELEKIASELERGDLNLDEAINKFEVGMKLSKKCSEVLEKAEMKINLLVEQENGKLKEEEFNV